MFGNIIFRHSFSFFALFCIVSLLFFSNLISHKIFLVLFRSCHSRLVFLLFLSSVLYISKYPYVNLVCWCDMLVIFSISSISSLFVEVCFMVINIGLYMIPVIHMLIFVLLLLLIFYFIFVIIIIIYSCYWCCYSYINFFVIVICYLLLVVNMIEHVINIIIIAILIIVNFVIDIYCDYFLFFY